MSIWTKLFGGAGKKIVASATPAQGKPEPMKKAEKSARPFRHPNQLLEFVQAACRSNSSIVLPLGEVGRLIDTMTDSLSKQFTMLDRGELFGHATGSLTLTCPNCGKLSDQAVSALYLAGTGMMKGATFGGPHIAALAQGRCSGCGGTTTLATFDPSRLIDRAATLTSARSRSARVATLKPTQTQPFLSSLTSAPGEEKLAWVSGGTPGKFKISIASTEGTLITEIVAPGFKYPPSCVFVGTNALLVSTHVSDNLKQTRLALYETKGGNKLSETDLDDCYFSNPDVQHDEMLIAAEKDMFTLTLVSAVGKKLTSRTVEVGQIYSPGPQFGPDGRLYFIHGYALHRLDADKKTCLMSADNCICFGPSGKIYCGGGHSDRSGASALRVFDLKTNSKHEIPWGKEPIDELAFAGEDRVLIATSFADRYPYAYVTLLSLSDRRKVWQRQVNDLQARWERPLLCAAPLEGWALIQTGAAIFQVSLTDGKDIAIVPRKPKEMCEALWLNSSKTLCLARKPDWGSAGSLEWYALG